MPAKNAFRAAAGLLAVAATTVLTWWAWLGRDTTYTVDPVTGSQSGPYSTAQVAGAVLTLAAVLIAAVLLRVPPMAAALTMTVAFTAAWTVSAAATDDSGLFMVGAILVLAGMTAGTTIVALVTKLARRSSRSAH